VFRLSAPAATAAGVRVDAVLGGVLYFSLPRSPFLPELSSGIFLFSAAVVRARFRLAFGRLRQERTFLK